MIKWCSVTYAAVMFADCLAMSAAAAVLADVLVLAVAAAVAVLAAVTVWNDVVGLPTAASAAMVLKSLVSVAVAACFAVEPVRGSAAELVHAAE